GARPGRSRVLDGADVLVTDEPRHPGSRLGEPTQHHDTHDDGGQRQHQRHDADDLFPRHEVTVLPAPTSRRQAGCAVGRGYPRGVIDLKALRDDPDTARASQVARGADPALVDQLLAADERRRSLLSAFEQQRAEQKELSRSIGKAAPSEREAVLGRAKQLAEQVKDAEAQADAAAEELDRLLWAMPNIIVDGVPAGGEEDFVELRQVGTPRD